MAMLRELPFVCPHLFLSDNQTADNDCQKPDKQDHSRNEGVQNCRRAEHVAHDVVGDHYITCAGGRSVTRLVSNFKLQCTGAFVGGKFVNKCTILREVFSPPHSAARTLLTMSDAFSASRLSFIKMSTRCEGMK